MKLTEFLLARIAEDEACFHNAVEAEVQRCRADGMPDLTAEEVRAYWLRPKGEGGDEVERAGTEWPRYLAEVEAKRRIVAKAQRADVAFSQSINPTTSATSFALTEVLHLLALPYASHPDYDPEWRL